MDLMVERKCEVLKLMQIEITLHPSAFAPRRAAEVATPKVPLLDPNKVMPPREPRLMVNGEMVDEDLLFASVEDNGEV